ncbi:MAG: hypothetical protein KatS3mg035_1060 [Bacteroidia bacterium]|nr:MAG: hypothetical protein KatS3mg035_1060 [Bacteroidia bacterium]
MASCEKCWSDAYMRTLSDPMKSQYEHYVDLIKERYNKPCNAEQQAGDYAVLCPKCNRYTVHQFAHKCVICGYEKE